ncbi:hypothetical protein MMC30_005472 [Trapelia coarctata]|nr:hypothetical protein [Trapelia coarctata]
MELLGRIAYEFSLIQPYIPTYLHLLVSALFPIYTGAHASLSRPSSAAKPPKRKRDADEDEDERPAEKSQRMEGLSPSDAILYPLLTGCMLAGLYFLIKWLQDPAILNKILNWYLSVFGILSITRLLSDSVTTITSYAFPARYNDGGSVWEVKQKQKTAAAKTHVKTSVTAPAHRSSPLPGLLSQLPLPRSITKGLWALRGLLTQPVWEMEAYMRGLMDTKVAIGVQGLYSFLFAIAAVLYFNLVDKPWWLTNLLGFSFSYSALQLMSPTTFWTGTLVLTSLFFYDIYFVFFTPLMITVATKLDIPVKLLFPRPLGADEDPAKKAMSMLGLGDIVLPGIMIGLALRFDLYLYYLKKQRLTKQVSPEVPEVGLTKEKTQASKDDTKSDVPDSAKAIVKAIYTSATGGWGERFWLGQKHSACTEGGSFPKTYFHASVTGYIIGMFCTLGVMHVFQHGQPALLYLVPGVLFSLWGTALLRGDLKTMWEYTEAEEEETEKSKSEKQAAEKKVAKEENKETKDDMKAAAQDEAKAPQTKGTARESDKKAKAAAKRRLFHFSISLPKVTTPEPSAKVDQSKRRKEAHASSEEWVDIKGPSRPSSSSSSKSVDTYVRRSSDPAEAEPAEKRRKLA